MKKPQIARKIARHAGLTSAEAADHLDSVVSDILTHIRRGQAADVPGLGRFHPEPGGRIRFEQLDQEDERA